MLSSAAQTAVRHCFHDLMGLALRCHGQRVLSRALHGAQRSSSDGTAVINERSLSGSKKLLRLGNFTIDCTYSDTLGSKSTLQGWLPTGWEIDVLRALVARAVDFLLIMNSFCRIIVITKTLKREPSSTS
eukprot:6182414-Pleurochrysis_carterae.AAC.2